MPLFDANGALALEWVRKVFFSVDLPRDRRRNVKIEPT
jgi:hypothetical protein